MIGYDEFLARKSQLDPGSGFEPNWEPEYLYPFQRALTRWAIKQGRAALFCDCGLGKSPMELVWAQNVHRHTGKPVLLITPLAVGFQMGNEAEKFGIEAAISRDGTVTAPITITNYERLEKFNPDDYGGVVCDESSAIKAFDGVRRAIVTEFLRRMPHRLLGTATAAPNDYIELGTSSEALGQLGHIDMLNRFFINAQRTSDTRAGGRFGAKNKEGWRFKGHGQDPFWRWVSSWARAIRKPSDLGFDDAAFILPPLEYRTHLIEARKSHPDVLFDVPANGLAEEREVLRRTINERCEKAAELIEPWDISIAWCNLNDEGNLLEKLIPNSIQVSGSDTTDYKEAATEWFTGRRCICDNPLFRSKLAAWDGSRNTPREGVSDTNQIPLSVIAERAKAEHQKQTSSTCASTTPPTLNGSSGEAPSSEPRSTPTGEPAMQTTPSTGIGSNAQPATLIPSQSETPASSDTLGSPQRSTTDFLPTKATAARSAAQRSETHPDDGYPSITATRRERSGASSAQPAISVSGNSTTTLSYSTEPNCICGHKSGVRRLITKARIFGWGLNFQHAHHATYFPSHSYEQMYQAVRRSWRFGQQHPVTVDVIITEGGAGILENLQRKASQADAMFEQLVTHMGNAVHVDGGTNYTTPVALPTWIEDSVRKYA